MEVVAVIPTFRPTEDLRALVRTLSPMVGAVVVADDASPNTADPVLRAVSELPGVEVFRFAHNRGIARGLNAGLAVAHAQGARWLLTVDQDSSVSEGFVEALLLDAVTALRVGLKVGVMAPEVIADASGVVSYPTARLHGWSTTAEVFQTGALWSVEALVAGGGFNEDFGIDAIDAEACLSLRENGYAVALSPRARIGHSWGTARQVTVLGRTMTATGHSPQRRTTMVRNRLRLLPREVRQSPRQAVRSLRRLSVNTALAVTVERDRWAKARGSIRGVLGFPPRSN